MGVRCDRCNKQFSSRQYLIAHISAKSNVCCWEYYYRSREKRHTGTTTDGERALKRQRMIERREAIIRGQKLLGQALLASKKLDLSVFDFCDESPQPKSFPCVLQRTATVLRVAASASGVEQDDGEEETQEHNEMPVETVEGEDPLNEEEDTLNQEAAAANEGDATETPEDTAVNEGNGAQIIGIPANSVRNTPEIDQFKEYVERAHLENGGFSPEMEAGIELMHKLNAVGGSLVHWSCMIKSANGM